ncbi:hypothetical protein P7H06_13570 [Paenibacillus larvae]|nr:hypothetical protein [Paenibacillus larvae]MDT2260331.1 hypothetical protein [Paenibacillus larvae]
MSSYFTPLLTVHLFVTDKISKDKLKEPILRLEENHITVKMYGPEDPLVDAGPRKPRVYVSIGDEWKPFTTLRSLPIQEKTLAALPFSGRTRIV